MEVSTTFTGWVMTLTDGRTVEERQQSGVTLLGSDSPGVLVLARDTDPKFVAGLDPSSPGCWEGWPGPTSYSIVWDMGDSLLFSYNFVELPKAPGFSVDRPPETHDGHPAWVYNANDARWLSFCVNAKGQVAWGKTVP